MTGSCAIVEKPRDAKIAMLQRVLYTVSQKTRHLTLARNFAKYRPIFKLLSLLDSAGNL